MIFYTFIQMGFGRAEKEILEYVNISSIMYKKIPTMFKKLAFEGFREFLRVNGIKEITEVIKEDTHSIKHYGYFVV